MGQDKAPSINDLVKQRLQQAYQSSRLARSLQPGQAVNVPAPDDLVSAFEYFSNQISALEEIVLVLARQIDELRSK